MNTAEPSLPFGAPGIEPRWTSSAKEGVGTAYHTSSRVWFTLSHGIVNEIYYPRVDSPITRDFQFLVTDGETFCHEERRHLRHRIEYPEKNVLYYRLINEDPAGRYRLVKDVIADPHQSVLLVHTRLETDDPALRGKLRLYALLAPFGAANSAWCREISGTPILHAQRENAHLIAACSCGFARRSVGFVGYSDGWQDLMGNFRFDWEFRAAEHGNVALTGEIVPPAGGEFTVAVACGGSYQSTAAKLLRSLAEPFERQQQAYVRQWQRALVDSHFDFHDDTGDDGHLYRLSRLVLLTHEDKSYQGAMVASLSIPWGDTKGENDRGGYHLVWTRDLVQSATALLATGQIGTPIRALLWLAASQHADGSFPQNSWLDGDAYWPGQQLDEVAAPILLAWRLRREGALNGTFDPHVLVQRAASYLMLQGPVTGQDRWEESSGYSPSTLAAVIAALVCAADFATERDNAPEAEFALVYADWLASHLEDWTVTTQGELVPGFPRHYLRINPTEAGAPDPHADPNATTLQVANGGGRHPARNVVGGDFLQLVRLGIRAADDPVVRDSVEVIDRTIKVDLPQGPGWRRYNHDGYGDRADGSACDGAGIGRCWPLLTGERAHYELAAGRDPLPLIKTIEAFAGGGEMLPEQIWDADDLPDGSRRRGGPTGAAMPLCWSHAEYVTLVRSRHDGVPFDRIGPAYDRYVVRRVPSAYALWLPRHPVRRMEHGKILRLILARPAAVVWTKDRWATTNHCEAVEPPGFGVWHVDFPTGEWPANTTFTFTLFWKAEQRWEGRNWDIAVR